MSEALNERPQPGKPCLILHLTITMPLPLSSAFYALTIDEWERIAFYTVASKHTFLGPPSSLCTLSLVCRHVHDAVSINKNSRLFAEIFRFKFDYRAPVRRFSERWLTTRCLAIELVKRFTALGRIRQRSSLRHDDLWTCYLMCVFSCCDQRLTRYFLKAV
jgi:hypothetical protein